MRVNQDVRPRVVLHSHMEHGPSIATCRAKITDFRTDCTQKVTQDGGPFMRTIQSAIVSLMLRLAIYICDHRKR